MPAAARARPARPPPGPPGFFGWITRLVRDERSRLLAAARREGLGPDDAIDCVQDAFTSFLALPEARRLAMAPQDAARLLMVLTRNSARNRRRKHDLARPHLSEAATVEALRDESPDVEALISGAEERLRLLGCINTLGRAQKAVVALRMLEGRPGEDVARTLKTTPGNVAVLLHRAKQELHGCLLA